MGMLCSGKEGNEALLPAHHFSLPGSGLLPLLWRVRRLSLSRTDFFLGPSSILICPSFSPPPVHFPVEKGHGEICFFASFTVSPRSSPPLRTRLVPDTFPVFYQGFSSL